MEKLLDIAADSQSCEVLRELIKFDIKNLTLPRQQRGINMKDYNSEQIHGNKINDQSMLLSVARKLKLNVFAEIFSADKHTNENNQKLLERA